MKERPILFSPPMVQALLDGRKTQTRRTSKLNEVNAQPSKWRFEGVNVHGDYLFYDKREVDELVTDDDQLNCIKVITCPYGIPGDRLWVRESHCIGIPGLPNGMGIVPIKSEAIKPGMKVVYRQGSNYGDDPPPWRPSIHMPQWASRITLEITEVRVQKLGAITESDAQAEGVKSTGEFLELWKSIHQIWEPSLWVWVLAFRRVLS